jgi:hypothetical protein
MSNVGIGINALLRLGLAYFLGEVLLKPEDPRFAGKAIPVRNLIIVGGLSLLFPALHVTWKDRPWRTYPWRLDNLHLSIFWLDMAGNSFNLYDRYFHFDLIPHAHGTGALALILEDGFGQSALTAVGTANIVHLLLEAQEYYTDVFFGTHNVRGTWDVINDLLAGLVGSSAYALVNARVRGQRRRGR